MDSKVIRAPSLKRGKNDGGLNERIKLKKVLGLTVCSNAALDVSPTTGVLAYPAGCTVVLFNSKKLSQSYLLNTSRKAITAIAYSQCGRYVATGECGQNPAIKVWELDPAAPNGCGGTVIAEFLGHKYAVSCIAFSPTGKYLVSVGSQHDMIVNVFDWKLNLKIASNKVSAKVVAVCFSQDGNYFVTVGNRHVKYWYLEGSRKYKEPIPLMGRSAILGELRNNDFCAVACGKGDMADSTYAITRSGQLVEFNSRRLLDKWVACLTTSANCLCISSQYILVGCAESMIRVFDAATLQYLTTLPRTHYLGTDVAQVVHFSHLAQVPAAAKFPDTIAMVFDEPRMRVSCVYNDHSLYIWDLRDIRRVGVSHSFLYHSACIWGVESVPYNFVAAQAAASGAPVPQPPPTLPVDCFLTCSSDDTIRFWALDEPGAESASPQPPNDVYRKNIYSKDLLKVVYIDEELQFIKDVDNPILNMEKPSTYDGRNGVRCIKISPDRQHLATGDRSGNIRIYSLANLRLITTIEAHDSEVLCLEYTNEAIERRMLASASRDRLIHVFDVANGYRILQTLDDHSSSITSVKFIGAGAAFQMVSCGADKSIIFRTFQGNQFLRGNNCSGKTTLYDMEIDSNAKHILTACQDRNIRIYGTQTAKHTRTFKGSHSDDGSLIKLSLDLSGIYVATSCTDKTLSVYDHYSAECMARMYGHSELVTGLKFTNDCKHLISASGDGCIFIWQVPHDMVVTMQARLSQQALRSGHAMVPQPTIPPRTPQPPAAAAQPLSPSPDVAFGSPPPNFGHETMPPSGYRFSDVGQLPQWAKKKPEAEPPEVSPPASVLSSSPGQGPVPFGGQSLKPRGRWAQKATFEPDALDLRGVSGSPSGVGTSGAGLTAQTTTIGQTSDYNSASSKDVYLHHGHNHNTYLSEDSSIDSGMENRRELMFVSKGDKKPATGQLQFESNNEHDGDIEDISDGERTSSEHGGLFYPAAVGPGTPTEFKVNAMNEDELRKSVRRQKFERQGLQLSAAPAASVLSSGGGTGTSDDEDEGSTPSGDNAERSLASTLGGSSESIPAAVAASATAAAASSSFMQAAIDGASSLSDRGDRSRRSISAKHNSSDSKSFSKSFSNSKKDELMKVINEAKQKLENGSRIDKLSSINEVGYRSTLRSSQSISDLSHAANMERAAGLRGQRNSGDPNHFTASSSYDTTHTAQVSSPFHQPIVTNSHRTTTTATKPQPYAQQQPHNQSHHQHHQHNHQPTYLHSAAPKSVLTQNCNFVRQLQRDLPPYPVDIGVYSATSPRPSTLDLPAACAAAPPPVPQSPTPLGPRHPSILKHYKSCPVSPVHEELDWSNVAAATTAANAAANTLDVPGSEAGSAAGQKRHSMYGDDAQTILDMIHSDTEKMIAEITQKYGDLDEYDPIKKSTSAMELKPQIKPKPKHIPPPPTASKRERPKEHGFLSDDEHFSSDSLEDCSLGIEAAGRERATCRKHARKPAASTLPKRSVSDYFIYDQPATFGSRLNPNRNVSLSDILNEDPAADSDHDHAFLSTQRHSSASFFLGPYPETRKSQESLLSDDISGTAAGSYCNSMESILSDESECKSAPLEALFVRSAGRRYPGMTATMTPQGNNTYDTAAASKSYGSSPNACSGFDFYMQNQHRYADNDLRMPAVPDIDVPLDGGCGGAYPWITAATSTPDEYIPRMGQSRAAMVVNKSLSKEFADHRHQHNTNPMFDDVPLPPTSLGRPKAVATPAVSASIKRVDVFNDPSVYVMRKSCSFDIDMFDGRRTQRSAAKKYEQNLEKFEMGRKGCSGSGAGGTMAMEYVPHKPPVATRRSSSMRNRRSNRATGNGDKERFHTVVAAQKCATAAAAASSSSSGNDEKSFEIYVAEKGAAEDLDSVDSLEFYAKPRDLAKVNSVDSLDEAPPPTKPSSIPLKAQSVVSADFLTPAEYTKFRDIEKKIDVINKLVELEERKLEHERRAKERRVRPFQCDSQQKGYVKSLTMNFDRLARQEARRCDEDAAEEERERRKIKRNFSLPDVLEGAKFRAFDGGAGNVGGGGGVTVVDCDDDDDDGDGDDGRRLRELRMGFREGNPKSLLSHHALSDDDPSSSIRRACSLSDLSMGKAGAKSTAGTPLSATNNNNLVTNSGKPTPATRSAAANGSAQTNGRNPPKRTVSTTASTSASGSGGMGSRSISVGTLNQPLSDSDPEAIANRVGLQRPTISSLNKNNGNSTPSSSRPYNNNTKSAAGLISRRRGMSSAYSSVNLTTAGQDDSSSEEAQSIPAVPNGKPAVPPRPRSISIEHKRNGLALNLGANNNHNTSAAGSPLRSAVRPTSTVGDEAGLDVDGSDLSAQLCSNIISQLMATTNSVMQLHQRLKHGDETATAGVGGARHKNQMLKELENAVIMTQSMLTTVTASRDSGGGTTSTGPHVTFVDSNRHSEQNGNGGSQQQHQQQQQQQQSMLDKCTDMLHKVQKQHSTSAHNS